MHIGMVVINSSIGGTEKRFSNLFRLLSAQNAGEYHLFVPENLFQKYLSYGLLEEGSNPKIIRLYRTGIKAVYPMNPLRVGEFKIRGLAKLFKPLWRSELNQKIATVKPDILHVALPTDHLKPLPKMPIVVEMANNTGENLNAWLVRQAVKTNCLFNCASEGIQEMLIRAYPEIELRSRTRVIPCSFIDYSYVQFESEKIRQKQIVFMGRFEVIKNPFFFLEIIELLAKQRNDFCVSILGTGTLEQSMRTWVQEHQLSEIIKISYSINPIEVLTESLIYFSAYQHDNYHSQALLEAMASGCAILASDIGETRKVVDENCGFLTHGDPEEIVRQLNFLLDHEDIAKLMGENARRKVMREQTFERYSANLMDIYRESLELYNSGLRKL